MKKIKVVVKNEKGESKSFNTTTEAAKYVGCSVAQMGLMIRGGGFYNGYTAEREDGKEKAVATQMKNKPEVFNGYAVFEPFTGEHRCNRCIFAEDERCLYVNCEGGYFRKKVGDNVRSSPFKKNGNCIY